MGDLARQQRERVRNSAAAKPHVFTNEDLKRPKILDAAEPEPMAVDAPRTSPAAPSATAAATANEPVSIPGAQAFAAPVWPEGTPLGDVARYYRAQKQLRTTPTETPVVAQSEPKVTAPVRQPGAPRPTAATMPPQQPPQRPKRIIAVAAPAVLEKTPAPRVVRVNAGDSLWKIAARYLGDGNQWRVIASVNLEIANPDVIHAGQQLRLPDESVTTTAAAAPENQVRVQVGDSLWKLAKAQWGKGQAWSCIAEANPQIRDSSRIYPGQTLTLPATCSPVI